MRGPRGRNGAAKAVEGEIKVEERVQLGGGAIEGGQGEAHIGRGSVEIPEIGSRDGRDGARDSGVGSIEVFEIASRAKEIGYRTRKEFVSSNIEVAKIRETLERGVIGDSGELIVGKVNPRQIGHRSGYVIFERRPACKGIGSQVEDLK